MGHPTRVRPWFTSSIAQETVLNFVGCLVPVSSRVSPHGAPDTLTGNGVPSLRHAAS